MSDSRVSLRRLAAALQQSREAEEAARDEQALLAAVWEAFNQAVAQDPEEPEPAVTERLVIQNWKAEPSFVPIGDVDVELEPGQSVALRVNRARSVPELHDRDTPSVRNNLIILCEDEPLIG